MAPRRFLVELRTTDASEYELGSEVTGEAFGPGQTGDSLVYLDDITVTIVPEPATVGVLGLGAALFGLARRRNK